MFLALKSFQNTIQNKRILIATDNATVVSYLNKQGGTHSWDMIVSSHLAHLGLLQSSKYTHKSQTYSGLPQCHSRQPLQKGQNNTDIVVSPSSNIESDLQSLAQTNGRHVCHQNESQTSALCVTSPRCKCTEHRCIEHLLGGSGWLCLLSCSSHSKSHSENEHQQVQNDCSGP